MDDRPLPIILPTLPIQPRFGRDQATEVKNQAYDLIWDNLPEIIVAIIDSARGLHLEEQDPISGQINRYQRPPDIRAAKWLAERVLGGTPRPREDPLDVGESVEALVARRAKAKIAEVAADRIAKRTIDSLLEPLPPKPIEVEVLDPKEGARRLLSGG